MAASSSQSSSVNKRKYFIEDTAEITYSGSLETQRTAAKKTNVSRSMDCGSPWWTKEHLPAAEALWALTLQSALPYLNEQHWEEVPDLPHPSAAETKSHVLDQQHWCDLNGKVPPFPEPSPVSQQSPHLQFASSKQTKARPETSDISLSSLFRQEHEANMVTIKSGYKKDQAFPRAIAGPSRVEEERLKHDEKRPTAQVSCFGSQPLDQKEGIIEEPMETEEGKEKKCSDTKRAEETLNSCPMCLHVFSVGASQMDRDGHLAQCLSDMNVDMRW
ncbi:uncharacterized protein si:ch73-70k4.1 isoform X1 [Phycodurus eques]|uniref:uncharacterized protein si:ch73-70k4.1 isoform X1 n=1 Tax=Phycodurus eques TaxID=693459 RepID=UPI002ACEED16|nr:uncharacterized protein si:ch73-70k4.1 isoform X1 [Phycodurus eques]